MRGRSAPLFGMGRSRPEGLVIFVRFQLWEGGTLATHVALCVGAICCVTPDERLLPQWYMFLKMVPFLLPQMTVTRWLVWSVSSGRRQYRVSLYSLVFIQSVEGAHLVTQDYLRRHDAEPWEADRTTV